LYLFVKYLVRLGLLIFFRRIVFNNKELLNQKGPLLLACNHPNSFLDALILGALFKQPVHFLARGDAFKKPFIRKILTTLKAIPIYRLKEGKEYLALNDNTFERCLHILKNNGIVLIFSEGLCLNQWQLRTLKKGTARIAISAWKQQSIEDTFRVLPVNFNYSSFNRFRKNVIINFRTYIHKKDLSLNKSEAEQILDFNKLLNDKLEQGMLIENTRKSIVPFLLRNSDIKEDHQLNVIPNLKILQKRLEQNVAGEVIERFRGTKRVTLSDSKLVIDFLFSPVLFLPALIGLAIHLPLYLPINHLVKKKTNGTVFYHSALFGTLILVYPVYVIFLSACAVIIYANQLFFLMILLLPLSAIIFLLWKDCVESIYNNGKLSKEEKTQLKLLINS
jgi:1-acyl-sn-glycerol-3-phosphate acyltransferase